jgi:potassium-transporting ATPase KdpC subunit
MTSFVRRVLWPAIALLVVMTVLTGAAYPAVITAAAQVVFPHQANGSLIVANGQTVGSTLIGQCFDQDKYFWGRLSAAGVTDSNPCGYDANASAGSNLGPTSQDLIDRINSQVADWQAKYGNAPIPVDLVTTSASGFDPDITPAGADYQVARVALARGMTEDAVRAMVAKHTEGPLLGFLGQPRVHVLELNLDLDGLLQ